jgi:hypothetical protein
MLSSKNILMPVKLSVTLMVSIILFSCDMPGELEFKQLCEKEEKQEIYDAAVVHGYYDDVETCSSCWRKLIYDGYHFVEFNLAEDETSISSPFSEPGLWRVSKVPKESGSCDEFITNDLNAIARDKRIALYIKDGCFMVEKVESILSDYGFFAAVERETIDNKNKSVIIKREEIIKNMRTEKIVAVQVWFTLAPKRISQFGSTHTCFGLGLNKRLESQSYKGL